LLLTWSWEMRKKIHHHLGWLGWLGWLGCFKRLLQKVAKREGRDFCVLYVSHFALYSSFCCIFCFVMFKIHRHSCCNWTCKLMLSFYFILFHFNCLCVIVRVKRRDKAKRKKERYLYIIYNIILTHELNSQLRWYYFM